MRFRMGILIALGFVMISPDSARAQAAVCSVSIWDMELGTGGKTFDERVAKLKQKCRPGDIIGLDPGSNGNIAAFLCDFTKQIVHTRGGVLCVMTAFKPDRNTGP